MSKEYKDITDRVISILRSYQTGALSADMSNPVAAVLKGQYVPTNAGRKSNLFVRYQRSGLVVNLAGGKSRQERTMLRISGGCVADTQDIAIDDATILMNNVEQVMMNHIGGEEIWGSGCRFGWRESEDNPEVFGDLNVEPGVDVTIAHFTILWSCDALIKTDLLIPDSDML